MLKGVSPVLELVYLLVQVSQDTTTAAVVPQDTVGRRITSRMSLSIVVWAVNPVMETVVLIEYLLLYRLPRQRRQATERRVVPLSMPDVEMGCAALEVIIAVGLGDEPPQCCCMLLNISDGRHWVRLLRKSELVSDSMGSMVLDG